jgi:crotonobetainyl-CoA:carnitine CoA-transferase CaiB-like acyl-CoA transferase
MSYDLLDGITVVELSLYAFAPSAGAILADWGADVIKVVPPRNADPMMGNPIAGLPQREVGIAFMWELLNRGKRCVGIDVSDPDGRDTLLELLREADVFLTNLLPGARKRFGVDVGEVQRVNPSIVYARASAHGAAGPERDTGGYDHTDFWARTGIGHSASQVADEFVPQPGPALGDLSSGSAMAGAIAAALLRRERTGRAAVVDVSLLSTAAWIGAPAIVASQLYGVETIPRMRHKELSTALVAAYATRDERLIYLAGVVTEGAFENFCQVIGRKDLLDHPKFGTNRARHEHRGELIDLLDDVFAARDLEEWLEILPGLTSPWTVVQSAAEAAVDQQVIANNYVVNVEGAVEHPNVASPAQFDGIDPSISRAPGHGEHTDEVLLELGKEWDEILALKESDAVL